MAIQSHPQQKRVHLIHCHQMIQLFQHHARYNASKYLKEYDDFSLNLVLNIKTSQENVFENNYFLFL